MKITPVGSSLLIELIERAKRDSGLFVEDKDKTTFTGEVVALSSHLETNSIVKVGDTVIYVGRAVETPEKGMFIIDAEQILAVIDYE